MLTFDVKYTRQLSAPFRSSKGQQTASQKAFPDPLCSRSKSFADFVQLNDDLKYDDNYCIKWAIPRTLYDGNATLPELWVLKYVIKIQDKVIRDDS